MKDILFIGGPEKVRGVERIKDDVLSILSVKGLFSRKAVVVWPTEDFLCLPADSDSLSSVCDMTQVEISEMWKKKLVPLMGASMPFAEFDALRTIIREDQEAMDEALIAGALTQAFHRLTKLIAAVSGGQNLVVILSKSSPPGALCWTDVLTRWAEDEAGEVRNYKSSDSGYGVLNSINGGVDSQ